MRYLLRFLLVVLAVGCILGARRVSRAQVGQPAAKATAPVAQKLYLPQAAK